MRCPLCGNEFDPVQAEAACQSCPLGKKCNLVCCPRCGYHIVDASKSGFLLWLKKITGKGAGR